MFGIYNYKIGTGVKQVALKFNKALKTDDAYKKLCNGNKVKFAEADGKLIVKVNGKPFVCEEILSSEYLEPRMNADETCKGLSLLRCEIESFGSCVSMAFLTLLQALRDNGLVSYFDKGLASEASINLDYTGYFGGDVISVEDVKIDSYERRSILDSLLNEEFRADVRIYDLNYNKEEQEMLEKAQDVGLELFWDLVDFNSRHFVKCFENFANNEKIQGKTIAELLAGYELASCKGKVFYFMDKIITDGHRYYDEFSFSVMKTQNEDIKLALKKARDFILDFAKYDVFLAAADDTLYHTENDNADNEVA